MEREIWPHDRAYATALVARTVRDIDRRGYDRSDLLLSDLMCAAWGSITAQNQ
jgi:hypothetical protein